MAGRLRTIPKYILIIRLTAAHEFCFAARPPIRRPGITLQCATFYPARLAAAALRRFGGGAGPALDRLLFLLLVERLLVDIISSRAPKTRLGGKL